MCGGWWVSDTVSTSNIVDVGDGVSSSTCQQIGVTYWWNRRFRTLYAVIRHSCYQDTLCYVVAAGEALYCMVTAWSPLHALCMLSA